MLRPRQGIGRSPYAWVILMVPTVLAGTIFAASTHPSQPATAGVHQQMGTICKFTTGPRSGDTQDYEPMQAPLNSPCSDGEGSSGNIIAASPAAIAAPAVARAADTPGTSPQSGSVCKFTSGAKAGSIHDYAPMHAPLGTACDDGAGSSGVIVAAQPMGTVCKFMSGPKSGSQRDYAPMHAPLGTACDDGAGSSGVIVAAQPMGTVCKFMSGPKAGGTQDYAPVHSPLNTPCDDGAGSSGIIVAAPQMGSVCRFTAGPKTGSSHDYAPMHALLNTPCNDGAGSSGIIVAAAIPDTSSCVPPSACKGAPNAAAPSATERASTPAPAASVPASGSAPRPGLGSVCKLTSGPKTGTTYDFAPMQAAIGAPCNYGPDNTGTIIAGTSPPPPSPKPAEPTPVMGSVCRFTSGPLALTTADFSPKRASLGTPCTDGHGSHGVIVEH